MRVWCASFSLLLLSGFVGCNKMAPLSPAPSLGGTVTANPAEGTPAPNLGNLPTAASAGDHAAALWVLGQGGSVHLQHQMREKVVATATDLPADDFKITQINLAKKNVNDADLARLAGLEQLEALNLNETRITAVGVAYLKRLPKLKYLNLCVSGLADEALAHLGALPELTSLEISNTAISDAGLAHLKSCKNLNTLYLAQTRVTPAGLENLKTALPKLEVKK